MLNSKKFINPEAWDTSSEFNGLGNFGKADVPGLDTGNMQKVMDELPRRIAAKINDIIDEIGGTDGAKSVGLTAIDGLEASTVQDALATLASGRGIKVAHGTAAPTGGSDGDIYIQHK